MRHCNKRERDLFFDENCLVAVFGVTNSHARQSYDLAIESTEI